MTFTKDRAEVVPLLLSIHVLPAWTLATVLSPHFADGLIPEFQQPERMPLARKNTP